MLNAATFILFGAVAARPGVGRASTWHIALYAVLSLTSSACCRWRSR